MPECSKMNVSFTSLVTESSIFLSSNELFFFKRLNKLLEKISHLKSLGHLFLQSLLHTMFKPTTLREALCESTLEYGTIITIKIIKMITHFFYKTPVYKSQQVHFKAAFLSYAILFRIVLERSKNLSDIMKKLIDQVD